MNRDRALWSGHGLVFPLFSKIPIYLECKTCVAGFVSTFGVAWDRESFEW